MFKTVFYARVSTSKDDQLHSFEAQQAYFENYIFENKDMVFVRGYADEGISGVSTKNRTEFLRMLEDAKKHEFDLILTKEVSRFARNTVDTLYYTRELSALGVGVIFTNDSIDTREKDGELRLTIMASLAQDESRKISDRVNWAVKRNFENGVAHGGVPYGYRRNEHKEIVIYEPEARIVRTIFRLYLQGYGYGKILKELRQDPDVGEDAKKWWDTKIIAILKNPKYCGDLVQGLSYTPDYLTKKRVMQTDMDKLYYIKDHHEPIISREDFEKVQEERERRVKLIIEDKTVYTNRYVFSNKIFCGHCKKSFNRRITKRKAGNAIVWRCSTKDKKGINHCPTKNNLEEEKLWMILRQCFEYLFVDENVVFNRLSKIFQEILHEKYNEKQIKEYEKRVSKLESQIEKLIDLKVQDLVPQNIFDKRYKTYTDELEVLKEKLNIDEIENSKNQFNRYLDNIQAKIKEYSKDWRKLEEQIVSKILYRVEVFDKQDINIYFNFDYQKSQFNYKTGEFMCSSSSNKRCMRCFRGVYKWDNQ